MLRDFNAEPVRKEIEGEISRLLNSVGIMFRVFSRTKAEGSLQDKLDKDSDYGTKKKIQDLIGIRIVLYFADDIATVRTIISSNFSEQSKDSSIDENGPDEFRAVRYNIIYTVSNQHNKILKLGSCKEFIDNTFELQIRTIFSEGWHEVEHDLRYKSKADWNKFDEQSRRLNGVYASLETSEWTMIKVFEELAYNHYKTCNWVAMFRQKFRLRFQDYEISPEILETFNDKDLAKQFFRLDRSEILCEMSRRGYYYPINLNNLIFFCNLVKIKDDSLYNLTPSIMIDDMSGVTD